MIAAVTARAALADRGFWVHYLQMLVAMLLGMVVLGMLWPSLPGVEVNALVMATNMTVGIAAWMLWCRHGGAAVVEMAAAMYLPFMLLFPPSWLGWLSADGLFLLGHVLMLPAMVLAMLRRPGEYLHRRGQELAAMNAKLVP